MGYVLGRTLRILLRLRSQRHISATVPNLPQTSGKLEGGHLCRQETKGPPVDPASHSIRTDYSQRSPALLKQAAAFKIPDVQTMNPFRPYHERLAHYERVRSRIFGDVAITTRKIKRNTLSMRNYWMKVKQSRPLLVSAIVNDQSDGRLYASISFL